jgi:hypothetical protein
MRSMGLVWNGESTEHSGSFRSAILLTCSVTDVTFGVELSGQESRMFREEGPGGELLAKGANHANQE